MAAAAALKIPAILLLLLLCYSGDSTAVNLLTQGGQALNSSSSLDSSNFIFSLSFWRYNSGNSSCLYLGIMHFSKFIFWIVNRDFPICDGSGRLVLDRNGTLKLTYSGGPPVELYSNTLRRRKKLTAVLEENGSLSVRDDSRNLLWQSFDSPTDSWLPGMKLGVVGGGGRNRKLTSWLSNLIPATGSFTLEWDPEREELVMKRRGVEFWTSGKQLGPDRFQNLDLTVFSAKGLDYNVTRFSNPADGDDYLTFGVSLNADTARESSFTILRLGHDGRIGDVTVDVLALDPDLCDGNSTENGCVRWQGPECRRSNGDRFYLPADRSRLRQRWDVDGNGSLSISDCKEWCWNHCQCAGVSLQSADNGTGCYFYRYGDSYVGTGTADPQEDKYRAIIGKAPRHYDYDGDGNGGHSTGPSVAPTAVPPAAAGVKNGTGKQGRS